MSVATAFSVGFLLVFSPLVSASAAPCPGPNCGADQAPVYTTTTAPCYDCEQEQTASTCRSHRSVIPYTSGSATYYISATTVTEQATCQPSTVYRSNGTNVTPVGPVAYDTVTLTVPTTETMTVTSWRKGKPPATVTIVSTEGGRTKTEKSTITKYQNGPAPATVTVVKTKLDKTRVVRTKTEVSTKTVNLNGSATTVTEKGSKKTITERVRVTPKPSTVTITKTAVPPSGYAATRTISRISTIRVTTAAATVTTRIVRTTTERVRVTEGRKTVTSVKTKTVTKAGRTRTVDNQPPGYTTTKHHTRTTTREHTREHTRTVKQAGKTRTRTVDNQPPGYTTTREHTKTKTVHHTKTAKAAKTHRTKQPKTKTKQGKTKTKQGKTKTKAGRTRTRNQPAPYYT